MGEIHTFVACCLVLSDKRIHYWHAVVEKGEIHCTYQLMYIAGVQGIQAIDISMFDFMTYILWHCLFGI